MIIDVNTFIGRWPFQKLAINFARALANHLHAAGISRALISSMDGMLYPDPSVCDAELFKMAAATPMLIPVPNINPVLANWRGALGRAGIKTVRIVPNYHNYPLTEPSLAQLMEALAERKIPLLIQMRVEDKRNQYPLMKIPGVDWQAVVRLANTFRNVPIVCLGAYFGEAVGLVQKTNNVSVDISFIETFQTLPALLRRIPPARILFGSHTPFLYTKSAVMKIETSRLAASPYKAIGHANAEKLFNLQKA